MISDSDNGSRTAEVAHVDGITDGESFLRNRKMPTAIYFLGGESDINLVYDLAHLVQEKWSIEPIICTQNGPYGFIYDLRTDTLRLNPEGHEFDDGMNRYLSMTAKCPIMQGDILHKNTLRRVRFEP